MANTVNVEKFLNILKKGTLNYLIDNIQIIFTNNTYRVGMRGPNSILILKGENDIITDIKSTDEWQLNFNDPAKNVKNYFELIMGDNVPITMKEDKIILSSEGQKSTIFFVSETVVSSFSDEGPKTEGDMLFEKQVDQELIDTFSLIKKVASSFGKVYFSQENKEIAIEGTDKTNTYSNGMRMVIGNTNDDRNVSVCFDFKVFYNVLNLLGDDATDFSFRIGYMEKSNMAMISFIKNDGTEKYWILSVREVA